MCFVYFSAANKIRKKRSKSKVMSGGFFVCDSEVEQRALRLLLICYSIANSYSSAPESNK